MYDELVERLMYCRNNAAIITDEELVEIAEEAADAIEELQRQIDAWVEPERKALIKSLPKWIPVTERLPEEGTKVMTFQPTTPNSDGLIRIGTIVGENRWIEAERHHLMRFPVTHWMPLPQPPKEET